jgi:hypothetical protein
MAVEWNVRTCALSVYYIDKVYNSSGVVGGESWPVDVNTGYSSFSAIFTCCVFSVFTFRSIRIVEVLQFRAWLVSFLVSPEVFRAHASFSTILRRVCFHTSLLPLVPVRLEPTLDLMPRLTPRIWGHFRQDLTQQVKIAQKLPKTVYGIPVTDSQIGDKNNVGSLYC